MTRRLAALTCGRRSKWIVLAAWVVLALVGVPLAAKLPAVQKNDSASFLPGDAESTQVLTLQKRFVGGDITPAIVVYERPTGITAADQAKAVADAQRFATIGRVAGPVGPPIPAADGKALQVVVPLAGGGAGWEGLAAPVTEIRSLARADARGMNVHLTGPAGQATDITDVFASLHGSLLLATLGVIVLILLVTYRSPLLWLLPLFSAGAALATAQGTIYLLARHAGLTVSGESAAILEVLVLGASTDYALLLVARYREELRRHANRHQAMAEALHRAGPAIVASAATVAVALLCLMVARLNSTSGMGPVAAIGVAFGLLAMVTLLPALLVIFGRWIFWPFRPGHGTACPTQRGVWARIGHGVAARPRTVWIGTALGLAAMAVGMVTMNAGPLADRDSYRVRPDSVRGELALARHFDAGTGSPLQVVSEAGAAPAVQAALAGTPGVTRVTAPQVRDGLAFVEATLVAAPDSPAAATAVERARQRLHAIPQAQAKVGGPAALNLDIQHAASRDRNVIIPLMLAVVFVIIALLLRAVVAPLVLIGTVVLSFAAALGVSSLVFSKLFHFAGTETNVPLFAFVFLVALGVDYNIFLMTRVREETPRHGTRRAALIGLAATGGVITSAGVVLAATFSVLGVLPLVVLAEIGFTVAFGVLLDTLVVRSVLVSALTLDLGRWMWWPSRLARERPAAPAADHPEPAPLP